jgi:GT2 family glycosyltransferase
MMMHLVIPTHGRPDLLGRALDSIAEAKRPDGLTVWVIENGSDAGARQACARRADTLPLEYVHLDTPGRSNAMQHAIETIGQGLVIFTDDDVRVAPDFFTAYAQAAEAHGDMAVYGGPLSIDYETEPPHWLKAFLPPSAVGWEPDDANKPIERASFLGANFAAFAERFLEVGGFNPNLGVGSAGNPVGEEFDMQTRLFAAGCAGVYVPGARVWHYVPADRCSPKWALQRHERIWFTNGMQGEADFDSPILFGAPRWMWRKLAGLFWRAAWANLHPSPQRRFEIRKDYYQYRGYLRGLRHQHAAQS